MLKNTLSAGIWLIITNIFSIHLPILFVNNSGFWNERISSWLKEGKTSPRRMICVIDDEKEHDTICGLAANGIRVMDVSDEWEILPEKRMIITGSFHMLLSRALNRGYGLHPKHWPIQFGLLHNDVKWCMKQQVPILDGLQESRKKFGAYNSLQYMHNRTRGKNMDHLIEEFFDTENGMPADVEHLTGEKPPQPKAKIRKNTNRKLWITLQDHLSHTVSNMKNICDSISCGFTEELLQSARYHDWAKSHPRFQNALLAGLGNSERVTLNNSVWSKRRPRIKIDSGGFFHDLAGGGAMLCDEKQSFLSSYLVMSHHGRFRTHIPDIIDKLPTTDLGGGIIQNEINIELTGQKYRNMFVGLYKQHGPFILAYLEALLRVADIRTSRQEE